MVRYKNKWVRRFIRLMLGSVTFPSYYLPTNLDTRTTSTNETLLFRLWGLTLGMTNDIIELTHPYIPKHQLTFLQPSRTSRYVYTRPDIGYLTYWIAKLRYFLFTKKMVNSKSTTKYTYNRQGKIQIF